MIDQTISHNRIVEKLGGGMGDRVLSTARGSGAVLSFGKEVPFSSGRIPQLHYVASLVLPNFGGIMKTTIRLIALVAGILVWQLCMAQAPAGAPAGATGLCNDGSYSTGATKKGACRGHKGVKDWYGDTGAAPAKTPAAAAAPTPAAAPAPATAAKTTANTAAPAPGGGAGQVWLNTATNVYHCEGTKWYGKTKAGAYMTEAEAKAKGAHADHGKVCN